MDINRTAMAAMQAHAESTDPQECCGLLLGSGTGIDEAQPAANIHPDPCRHFEIDPAVLIAAHRAERCGGPNLIGYYHSHPEGHPMPSATDYEHSSGDGKVWAIVGRDSITFWRDAGGAFLPLPYRAIDG